MKDNGKNKGKTNGDGKLNAAKPQFSDKSTAHDIVHCTLLREYRTSD